MSDRTRNIDSKRLADALRRAAGRLRDGEPFQWGHMGRCNCGYLAQELTRRSAEEIHREALDLARQRGTVDWTEHAIEHCPTTGFTFDSILHEMLRAGLAREDIGHLENLSDTNVLDALPGGFRYLSRNQREDSVLYMETWADLLDPPPPPRPSEEEAWREVGEDREARVAAGLELTVPA